MKEENGAWRCLLRYRRSRSDHCVTVTKSLGIYVHHRTTTFFSFFLDFIVCNFSIEEN